MKSNPILCASIAAVLSASAAGVSHAAAPSADAGDQIQEVIVTAQRRTENMQDVPITIQAMTSEQLAQLNVQTFDDFIKYVPNVTSASSGPGQSAIYIRGLSTTLPGTQGSGGVGSFPNVAVYLDDQSGALPARNLDIYAVDLERIEVLEGPQGTLFGAGAESGVVRYITNKPKLDVLEGNVNGAVETTAHGDPSWNGNFTINIPVIPDTLALRAVVYDDERGGYINNVPGTFVRQSTDVGVHYAGYVNNIPGPPNATNSANNAGLVGDGINTVHYEGFRVSALIKFNDDWNALLTESYQDMHSHGVFYEMPEQSGTPAIPLPDLAVQLYEPTFNNDRFENTALTVNGRIGDLKLVYTGGYLARNIEGQGDYTGYARGTCTATTTSACRRPRPATRPEVLLAGQLLARPGKEPAQQPGTAPQHAGRLADPRAGRGVLGELPGQREHRLAVQERPGLLRDRREQLLHRRRAAGDRRDRQQPRRASEQRVLLRRHHARLQAEGDFRLGRFPTSCRKTLTLTLGTRYYRLTTTEVGFSASNFNCFVYAPAVSGPAPCVTNQPPIIPNGNDSNNETGDNLNVTYSGFRSRANLSWKVTPDALLYATWSQGYRPGGFNRGSLTKTPPGPGRYTYQEPQSFTPDTLVNNEIGWKTQWFDHRLEFNGAVYQEDWKNVQVEFFEPALLGNLSIVLNGPDYRVRGLEMQAIARPMHGLTLTAAAAWNSSSSESSPLLKDVNGNPITALPQPFGALGSPLAQSPPLRGRPCARATTSHSATTPRSCRAASRTRRTRSRQRHGFRRPTSRAMPTTNRGSRPMTRRRDSARMRGACTSTAKT